MMKKFAILLAALGILTPALAVAQDTVPRVASQNTVPREASAAASDAAEPTTAKSVAAEAKPAKRGFGSIGFDVGDWKFKFGGFMQTAFDVYGIDTADDTDMPAPHTGFAHLNARLNFDISYAKNLSMRMSLDGAGGIDLEGGTEQTIGLKDIYIDYKVVPAFRMRLGQFKPPLDLENLTSETDANFTRRSIVSTGGSSDFNVKTSLEGTALNSGFSPSRELGLSLYSDVIGADGPVGFKYSVAVTNGNKATELLNDDEMFAVYGRVELGLNNAMLTNGEKGQFLTLAGGFSYEMLDFTPDDINDNDDDDYLGHSIIAYAELRAAYAGFAFDAEYMWRSRDIYAVDRIFTMHTNAFLVQAAYMIPVEYWRLQFAYRFAGMFVSNSEDNYPEVTGWLGDLMQHTAAIAYHVENYPIVIRAEYTHLVEYTGGEYTFGDDEKDGIGNDMFSLMVQVKW